MLVKIIMKLYCLFGIHNYKYVGVSAYSNKPILKCRECGKILRL